MTKFNQRSTRVVYRKLQNIVERNERYTQMERHPLFMNWKT